MAPKQELKTLECSASYTVAWIAALAHERAAALVMLDERHNKPKDFIQNRADNNSYTWGRIAEHNIVITSLVSGVYGTVSAATTAGGLSASLPHIRIGLFVGIGAGIPRNSDILLGDVVVSSPTGTNGGVVQYDLYKATQAGGADKKERKGFLNSPPPVLGAALAAMQAEHEISDSEIGTFMQAFERNEKMRGPYGFPGAEKDRLRDGNAEARESPVIHYGTIASGNTLIKNASERDELVAWLWEDNISPLCFEMEAAGLMNSFPCLIIRGICDYADEHKDDIWQKYAAATAAACAKELLEYVDNQRVEESAHISDVLKDVKQEMLKVQTELAAERESFSLQSKLSVAKGAGYDAHTTGHSVTCLPGTRTEVLKNVLNWKSDPEAKCIYWLCGKAGMGKSTIARTLGDRLSGELGASFFFKRGEGDCGHAGRFFPTIVKQLADKIPEARGFIVDHLDKDSTLCERSLQRQFEHLILAPFTQVDDVSVTDLIIIIDALDECEGEDDVRTILRLLPRVNAISSIRFRFFITSRPELPIQLGFRRIDQRSHKDVMLEELQATSVRGDIHAYFEHQFGEIRKDYAEFSYHPLPIDWPGQETIETLVTLAIPLFIFASTVCRYISQHDPAERLRSLLQSERAAVSGLGNMYGTILTQITTKSDPHEHQRVLTDFRDIVGSIVLLIEPLSAQALSELLDISLATIGNTLRHLYSVLDIPKSPSSPIRLLHLSFRDFLVESEWKEAAHFHVEEADTHGRLAEQCIRRLERPGALKQDICNVAKPGIRRAGVNSEQITACIPPDMAYACCHWVSHAIESQQTLQDDDYVHTFLQRHFLHWLEALSWLGRLSSSIGLLRRLRALVKVECAPKLLVFMEDAFRLIPRNRYVIDLAPLQLYHSALMFAPTESIVRRTFQHEAAWSFTTIPEVPTNWGAETQRLEGHSHHVNSVAFHPSGDKIASASRDKTIRIWDAHTGEELHTLHGHEDVVFAVSFSPDGQHLASASKDKTVRMWDTITGGEVSVLEGHTESVTDVAFSATGCLASSSLDATVRLWNVSTGNMAHTLPGHNERVNAVAFSPDGTLLASISDDNTARVWDARNGNELQMLTFHHYPHSVAWLDHERLALSTGGDVRVMNVSSSEYEQTLLEHENTVTALAVFQQRIASGSSDGTIRLWSSSPEEKLQIFQGHSNWVNSISFSPDGQRLVSGSADRTVRIWDVSIHADEKRLQSHEGAVFAIAFSADGTKLATGGLDSMVRIWDTSTGKETHKLVGHETWLRAVGFSPSGDEVVSGSQDSTACIWDISSGHQGMLKHTLRGHSEEIFAVAYSLDGSLAATGSDDRSVRVWEAATGKHLCTFEGQGGAITAVAFSNSGACVASASRDETIRVWNINSGEVMVTFETRSRPEKLKFSPSDRILHTDIGDCDITTRTFREGSSTIPSTKLTLDDHWICYHGKEILWLPHEYRGAEISLMRVCSAAHGDVLAIGQKSGAVSFFRIGSQPRDSISEDSSPASSSSERVMDLGSDER